MKTATLNSPAKSTQHFPPFDLKRLLTTIFDPKEGEKLCILIDLDNPADVVNFNFLQKPDHPVQKKAYNTFYQQILTVLKKELKLGACDFFAYKTTGGSNLELPKTAMTPEGKLVQFNQSIYPIYNIILCISDYSATAPLTATAKKFGFRGGTMHGMNDIILESGLAVDYNEVSKFTEKLRKGMTKADHVDIDFAVDIHKYHLHIDLGRQEAQKSHGICHTGPDIANLPAGEVYFVPINASGSFPMKFDDGTIGLMQVEQGRVNKVTRIRGNQKTINQLQAKLNSDPATGLIGELGFGTQVLPFANSDIQDEKIFGTFHIAIGRNDHLKGSITLDRFKEMKNATHEDILFSSTKTPEIQVIQVRMKRNGKSEVLIENYNASKYLWSLIS
jgi:aminopeptidase